MAGVLPSSRARSATTAARLPPALSPPTAMRRGAMPRSLPSPSTQRAPPHPDAPGADPRPASTRDAPPRARPRLVHRRRELVLGRETIVDGHDRDPRLRGDLSALHVVRVEVTDDPAAPVVEDERR